MDTLKEVVDQLKVNQSTDPLAGQPVSELKKCTPSSLKDATQKDDKQSPVPVGVKDPAGVDGSIEAKAVEQANQLSLLDKKVQELFNKFWRSIEDAFKNSSYTAYGDDLIRLLNDVDFGKEFKTACKDHPQDMENARQILKSKMEMASNAVYANIVKQALTSFITDASNSAYDKTASLYLSLNRTPEIQKDYVSFIQGFMTEGYVSNYQVRDNCLAYLKEVFVPANLYSSESGDKDIKTGFIKEDFYAFARIFLSKDESLLRAVFKDSAFNQKWTNAYENQKSKLAPHMSQFVDRLVGLDSKVLYGVVNKISQDKYKLIQALKPFIQLLAIAKGYELIRSNAGSKDWMLYLATFANNNWSTSGLLAVNAVNIKELFELLASVIKQVKKESDDTVKESVEQIVAQMGGALCFNAFRDKENCTLDSLQSCLASLTKDNQSKPDWNLAKDVSSANARSVFLQYVTKEIFVQHPDLRSEFKQALAEKLDPTPLNAKTKGFGGDNGFKIYYACCLSDPKLLQEVLSVEELQGKWLNALMRKPDECSAFLRNSKEFLSLEGPVANVLRDLLSRPENKNLVFIAKAFVYTCNVDAAKNHLAGFFAEQKDVPGVNAGLTSFNNEEWEKLRSKDSSLLDLAVTYNGVRGTKVLDVVTKVVKQFNVIGESIEKASKAKEEAAKKAEEAKKAEAEKVASEVKV